MSASGTAPLSSWSGLNGTIEPQSGVATGVRPPVRSRDALGVPAAGLAFKDMLAAQPVSSPKPLALRGGLEFSQHAVDRMAARGIRFSPEDLLRIEGAVEKAQQKGSKQTLILTQDSALIVALKDNKVVTVMDKSSLKENVFTNIDSTVVI